jgi:protein-L-isoaspartate O-methyltransferase
MSVPRANTLYQYYQGEAISPTFADLRDESSLAAYQTSREALLGGRLAIPIALIRGAEILEIGPDTGENAVVFARWGGRMTLVEPNEAAHATIRTYFDTYAPAGALRSIQCANVLDYTVERRFDLVVAEGFIYTVQPSKLWLKRLLHTLVPGGLALISYYERRASLFELLLRRPFAALRRFTGEDRFTTAKRLYRTKWDRIGHTRSFESWTMDVLDNPFVRLRYFIGAERLVQDMADVGIYSSWPAYRDGLENVWGKKKIDSSRALERTLTHLRRSSATFVLGSKAYLVDESEGDRIAALVDLALADTDALIDEDDAARSVRLAANLRNLAERIRRADTIADVHAIYEGAALLEAWADLSELLAGRKFDAVISRLNSDPVLLDGWGNPGHLAVLQTAAYGIEARRPE